MKWNTVPLSPFILPNFCSIKSIFLLSLGAELLAIVLILATGNSVYDSWDELGLLSIFVQWVALGSAGLLCLFRNQLAKLPAIVSVSIAYVVILIVTALVSFVALQFVLTTQYPWHDHFNGGHYFIARCMIISSVISLVALRYFYMQQQWKERIELESEARVQALQSRIRPHFLFNSMNIIASLIRSKPDLAEQAVEDLSELFRATLKESSSMVPLSEECVLCKHYLRIEGLRLGNRLQVHWGLSELPEDAAIPMLSLQPLIENAIYHGIQALPQGGAIDVEGHMLGHMIEIKVINPLPHKDSSDAKKKGHGIALQNIRHRLDLLFGIHGSLDTEVVQDLYKVTLRFPYIKAADLK